MGGDNGLRVSLPASLKSLSQFPDLELLLVGNRSVVERELSAIDHCSSRYSLVHAADVVTMDDQPAQAVKYKTESSMRVAIDLLARGEADAVVSAGNTGALMAMSTIILKTLPGIDRPAICKAMPSEAGVCVMLDLGANVDCSADQLQQFATMGSALVQSVTEIEHPRVALLNIGVEAGKGNEQVKQAAQLLADNDALNYIGFIEADSLMVGRADVIVCDGFVGNIALKASEGTANYIAKQLASALAGSRDGDLWELVQHKFDPRQYNGASLLGLDGVVVKSHGDSSEVCFIQAIAQAVSEVNHNSIDSIRKQLALVSR